MAFPQERRPYYSRPLFIRCDRRPAVMSTAYSIMRWTDAQRAAESER